MSRSVLKVKVKFCSAPRFFIVFMHRIFSGWPFSCPKLCRPVALTYTQLLRTWIPFSMSGTSSSVLAKIINLEINCNFYPLCGPCKIVVCGEIFIRFRKLLWVTEGDADAWKLQQGSCRPCYTFQKQ